MSRSLLVFVEIQGRTVQAGTAHVVRRRGRLSTTFTYHPEYVADPHSFPIDPAFTLSSGAYHVEGLPGAFQDCSPDRWGRNLIAKRLRAAALDAGQTPSSLSDLDFLTGVSDLTRQGALRFRSTPDSPFLAPDSEVPKLIELPRLLRAAESVAHGDDRPEAVKALLDAGTGSLGGARPKASIRSDDGRLLIAKFPHHHDGWDVTGWEKTALDLAEHSGIDTPPRRLVPIGGHRALLVERFDRDTTGGRAPYISAMTLVDGRDGVAHDYADVAEHLSEVSTRARRDLEALYRRAVLNVVLRNTDDHLRNLGFLLSDGGWSLAPAFDINPDPDPAAARQTTVGGAEVPEDEPEGLRILASSCHLDDGRARDIISQVVDATASWRALAATNGETAGEIRMFAASLDGPRQLLAS